MQPRVVCPRPSGVPGRGERTICGRTATRERRTRPCPGAEFEKAGSSPHRPSCELPCLGGGRDKDWVWKLSMGLRHPQDRQRRATGQEHSTHPSCSGTSFIDEEDTRARHKAPPRGLQSSLSEAGTCGRGAPQRWLPQSTPGPLTLATGSSSLRPPSQPHQLTCRVRELWELQYLCWQYGGLGKLPGLKHV